MSLGNREAVNVSLPYGGEAVCIVSTKSYDGIPGPLNDELAVKSNHNGLARAPRSETNLARYQLREQNRIGGRINGGHSYPEVSSRRDLGKRRLG